MQRQVLRVCVCVSASSTLAADRVCFRRYIVHSDDHNPYLDSMAEFAEKLKDFEPDLLVVGGLQMMDNFPFQAGERQAFYPLLI